jgi:hypothetical protein
MKQSGGALSLSFILWMVLALSCSSPAAVQQPLPVTVISLTSPVSHGNAASITVRTAPEAACTITVTYKSGPSRARGLDPKTADGNGVVSWTWIVGTRTTPGKWPIAVMCSTGDRQGSLEVAFEVL